tara:strand:- start:213 stop:500 length:288 start_codon:yes stop_codon:yes gene_type:complete
VQELKVQMVIILPPSKLVDQVEVEDILVLVGLEILHQHLHHRVIPEEVILHMEAAVAAALEVLVPMVQVILLHHLVVLVEKADKHHPHLEALHQV